MALFLFFKIYLSIHGLLWFHMNYGIVFSISVKKRTLWDFDRNCAEYVGYFG